MKKLARIQKSAPFCPNELHLYAGNTVYIKKEWVQKSCVWSIYNLNGEKLATAAKKEIVYDIINRHDFLALSVH